MDFGSSPSTGAAPAAPAARGPVEPFTTDVRLAALSFNDALLQNAQRFLGCVENDSC